MSSPLRPSLAGRTALVTGGAGFIGSHLTDRLLDEGAAEVVVVDNLFLGETANLAEALARGAVLYREDAEFATSLEYIFERHAPDVVFNCATKALNYSFANPSNAFSTNVAVVLNLLELQRKGRFRTLCHFSTSEVYGTAVYEPMDEGHPKNPTTAYAAGKAAADLAVESYVRMFGVDAFIVRPFNNFGPRQNDSGPLAGVIPVTARRILEGRAPEIHGNGEQSRDFIYVRDTVDAILRAFPVLPAGEAVNISAEHCIAIGDLIHMVAEALDWTGEIVRRPGRASDVACHNATSDRLRSYIPFDPTPFDQALRETLDWYRRRQRREPRV
ncbi:MAG: NAD-dependent epimerase/dehydratase family protein [Desulfovibrionaceae bacterium]